MKWFLTQQGFYWPKMIKDHIDLAKGCEECKKYGPIQRIPIAKLKYNIKPWPFRKWVLDLIKKIYSPSTKGHQFTLVAIDYYTKWVEPLVLKEVKQTNIIHFIE